MSSWFSRVLRLFGRGPVRRERAGRDEDHGDHGEEGTAPADRGPTVVTVAEMPDEHRRALGVLRRTLALGAALAPDPPDPPGREGDPLPADLALYAAGRCHGTEEPELGDRARHLARDLLKALVSGGGWVRTGLLGAGADLVQEGLDRLGRVSGTDPEDALRKHRKRAAEGLDGLLRELAADEHGLFLETSSLGEELAEAQLAWGEARTSRLEMVRYERLLQRLETMVASDEYLLLQRRISRWSFDRYAAEAKGMDAFARSVRRQEWGLIDRGLPGPRASVLELFLDRIPDGELESGMGDLALRLERSFSSLFEVMARDGPAARFEDLRTGRVHRVREHADATGYRPGELGLGRLIPGPDGAWLRSPGMAFLGGGGSELRDALAAALERAEREGLHPALAAEGVLMMLLEDETPPRPSRPALTRKLARELFQWSVELLAELGIAEETEEGPPPDYGDEVELPADAEATTLTFDADEATGEWFEALTAQARGSFRHGSWR